MLCTPDIAERKCDMAKEWLGKLGQIWTKYRYALLVALCGAALMLIPWGSKEEKSRELPETESFDLDAVERELEDLLSAWDGVGRCKVMLTLERSEEIVYVTEGSKSVTEGGSDEKIALGKITGDDGESALVRQKLSPVYRGALVLCDGAEDDGVQLRVTTAVASLLGLGSDRISVEPMGSKVN